MANGDSLFGDLDTGSGISPHGGSIDLNFGGDFNQGHHDLEFSDIFSGNPLSPHVAMMLQANLMPIRFADDWWEHDETGERMHHAEMWGKHYAKYFDPYDFRKENLKRKESLRTKLGKRTESARKMTSLKDSFAKQGFVSTGGQVRSVDNLYNAAVNTQIGEDISLRKDVMGMQSDWRNNMWSMMSQLAGQGAFDAAMSAGDTTWEDGGWEAVWDTETDDITWDDLDEIEFDYGGGG